MPETDHDSLIPEGYESALLQIASLSALRPDTRDVSSLHAGLVLHALRNMGKPSLPEDISSFLRSRLRVNLPLEAVVSALDTLEQGGEIQRHSNLSVSLVQTQDVKMQQWEGSFSSMKKRIIGDWLDQLDRELGRDELGELSALDRLYIENDLNIFLLQLVRYHGAEIALYLYPGSPSGASFKEVLKISRKVLFAELPEREDRLKEIRGRALPAFVREAAGERAEYIAGLLHRATLLQVLQVDSGASALFSSVLENKTLFLDTNFVFRVLGLQGAALAIAAREAINLGTPLGHQFKVSTETFKELKKLVDRQASWLSRTEEIPRELAGVAAEYTAGNDYVSAYWADRKAKGVNVEQFSEALSNLPLLLENYSIDISTKVPAGGLDQTALRDTSAALRIQKPYDTRGVVEHDAYHKVLIESLREADLQREPEGWFENGYIFVTFDSVLPLFAVRQAELGKGHKVPFCSLGHEWLEMLYFSNSEVDMSADTFVSLLNSPYLEAYFSRRALDRDVVRDVALTMAELREYRPHVAEKIFANRALTRRIEAMKDQGDRERALREVIRREAQAEDLRSEKVLAEKDAELEGLRSSLASKEEEISKLERRVREGRKGSKELSKEKRNLRLELETMKAVKEQQEDLTQNVRELQREMKSTSAELLGAKRWLLLFPGTLAFYAGQRVVGAKELPPVWMMVLVIASLPFVVGAVQQFRGKVWDLMNRVASLLTLIVFLLEFTPLGDWLKEAGGQWVQ